MFGKLIGCYLLSAMVAEMIIVWRDRERLLAIYWETTPPENQSSTDFVNTMSYIVLAAPFARPYYFIKRAIRRIRCSGS